MSGNVFPPQLVATEGSKLVPNTLNLPNSMDGADFPSWPRGDVPPPQLPICSVQGSYDVERTNEFEFYTLGRRIQRLLWTSPRPVNEIWFELWDARNAFHELMDGKPCPLGLSRGKAQAALDQLDYIVDRYMFADNEKGERVFSIPNENAPIVAVWSLDQAKRSIADFETVFAEEMREASTYRVPDRGIFSIPKLVDFADQAFPKALHSYIHAFRKRP